MHAVETISAPNDCGHKDYKDLKNREYLAKLDRAEAQFARGEYVTLTAEQLAAL